MKQIRHLYLLKPHDSIFFMSPCTLLLPSPNISHTGLMYCNNYEKTPFPFIDYCYYKTICHFLVSHM
ncbi:hypothetical protein GDO81_003415 [Engystomops pustulosus]|uniref:Uncharacterized protein n=1 Tax=Engystomops pustulosus TaxID=76066 RepID=A0AAV7A1V7_ENGPU|nr:hypothetical protein GDO81_003415 [Engystomops pustulosus]